MASSHVAETARRLRTRDLPSARRACRGAAWVPSDEDGELSAQGADRPVRDKTLARWCFAWFFHTQSASARRIGRTAIVGIPVRPAIRLMPWAPSRSAERTLCCSLGRPRRSRKRSGVLDAASTTAGSYPRRDPGRCRCCPPRGSAVSPSGRAARTARRAFADPARQVADGTAAATAASSACL